MALQKYLRTGAYVGLALFAGSVAGKEIAYYVNAEQRMAKIMKAFDNSVPIEQITRDSPSEYAESVGSELSDYVLVPVGECDNYSFLSKSSIPEGTEKLTAYRSARDERGRLCVFSIALVR